MKRAAPSKPLGKGLLVKGLVALVILLAAGQILTYVRLRRAIEPEVRAFEDEPLGIAQVVRRVKQELYEADIERDERGEAALFELDSFDLELNFVVETRGAAKAGTDFALVVLGKEAEVSSQRIQKIHLHMKAAAPVTGRKPVGAAPPALSAEELTTPPPSKEVPR
jgi:hypothetical protein